MATDSSPSVSMTVDDQRADAVCRSCRWGPRLLMVYPEFQNRPVPITPPTEIICRWRAPCRASGWYVGRARPCHHVTTRTGWSCWLIHLFAMASTAIRLNLRFQLRGRRLCRRVGVGLTHVSLPCVRSIGVVVTARNSIPAPRT